MDELTRLREENQRLKQQLAAQQQSQTNGTHTESSPTLQTELCAEEYLRYGRQMITPHFHSLQGQLRLRHTKVLVVGAGGLGCPAIAYLAGAGVGKLGIIDGDTVDESNLHRQILHTTAGQLKSELAQQFVNRLNPHVATEIYPFRLSATNAFDLFSGYDVILDCTDTPATRYLINDVAVLLGKPLVLGSGLKTEGQFTVLNFNNTGPCYRCFHPKPPPPDSVTSCSDGGVIGPVIGLVGTAMATEAIKVITGYYTADNFKPFLAAYSAYPFQQLRHFKMRPRKPDCAVCLAQATITRQSIEAGEIDYVAYCGRVTFDPLPADMRINANQFNKDSVIIDVRPKEQFDITKIDGAINVPITDLSQANVENLLLDHSAPITVVCRFGNDSQIAVQKLRDWGYTDAVDVIGGLKGWRQAYGDVVDY